jgi:hypothetical protein
MSKISFLTILLAVYIMPTLLIFGKIIAFEYRFLLLLFATSFLLLHAYLHHVSFRDLGFDINGFANMIEHSYPIIFTVRLLATFF